MVLFAFMPQLQRQTSHWLLWAIVLISAGCSTAPSRHGGADRADTLSGFVVVDDSKRDEVVLTALAMLNTRYRYGGSTPETGFDCSGLIAFVFRSATDKALPHNTATIARMSLPVSRSKLAPGDFVFFNTLRRAYSHMGIYIGEGRFVNAPSSGGRVRIDSLHNPYFAKHFEGARTLFRRSVQSAGSALSLRPSQ